MNPMQMKTPEERATIARKALATRRKNKEEQAALRRDALIYANGLKEQIAELERKLAGLKTMDAMATVSARLTGKVLLTSDEIAKAATPWAKASGVYFLLQGNEVVYVGQSVNIYARIGAHHIKNFDRFAYVLCSADMLDRLESLYIHCLRPRLNGNQCDGSKSAPIPLDMLVQRTKAR